jgi:glutamate-1-semialdehyde 2,1-aminomutase
MLKAGVYMPPSQFEACFLSTQHTQRDMDRTVSSIRKSSL